MEPQQVLYVIAAVMGAIAIYIVFVKIPKVK